MECFFCGREANTERGDICKPCERRIMSPTASILTTRPRKHFRARISGPALVPDVD